MISRERWLQLKALLEPTLDLAPEDVPAYLDQACRGDTALREEAERLLRAGELASHSLEFLDSPAAEFAAPLTELEARSMESANELEPGAAVGPYTIERRLGSGGMGVVYLAHDPRLDRKVALKLLPRWLAADDAATRRFVQEAKAASRLDHANIQTVYEIGKTADERVYIAMAFYDAETLQDRIRRGPLDLASAVDLACQIAEGLAVAHAHGIVHRDIKPGNVIVTAESVAKILDFGAAKIAGHQLTEGGVALGTVAYMSPEQTRREDVDQRTDVWSLGVVLYEMLAGRVPFLGHGSDAVIHAIRNDEPEPLTRVRFDVPQPLGDIVHRCLEKDPRRRYPDAAALAKDLRRTQDFAFGEPSRVGTKRRLRLLGFAALIATILLGSSVLQHPGQPDDASPQPSEAALLAMTRLAVLPLTNASPDPEDAYFADGVTEELISQLGQLGELRVMTSTSVMPYRDTDKSPIEISRELGVVTLLAGSVHKVGERVRISVRLVDARGQDQLWAHGYDVGIAEVPAVLRDIAEQVIAALRVPRLARAGSELAERVKPNPEAYAEYLKGRRFLEKLGPPDASMEARKYFERSLDFDPAYAPAWAGLSGAYNQLSQGELLPPKEAGPRARQAAEKALAFDSMLAEAHNHLAAALSWYYGDMQRAERHFRRALELEPSNARAHRHYSVHLRNLGRFDEALERARAAGELDALSPGAYMREGDILYMARRYDDAIAKLQQLLRVDPRHTQAYFFIALAYAQKGKYDSALAALRKTDPHSNRPNALAVRGYVFARGGQLDEAHRMLARLDELSASRPISSFHKATIRVGLGKYDPGEYDRALDLLEQAAEEGAWQMRLLKVEPVFDPLRSRPRFQTLLKKLNLTG